jgi:cellobiose-specific phosphotransferase system component IIC
MPVFFFYFYLLIYLFIYLFWFFETGFLCIVLAILEFILYTMLASNSEIHRPLPPKCWD